MLWIKAFHIIAVVAWFSGLFYLPRLYVYHADCQEQPGRDRFEIMERKLYYYIMWPAGIITTVLGLILLWIALPVYIHAPWMHIKLLLVILVWAFHLSCGYFRQRFITSALTPPSSFFRFYNEIPTILLTAIVLLVVLQRP